jgi:hypothetical protein
MTCITCFSTYNYANEDKYVGEFNDGKKNTDNEIKHTFISEHSIHFDFLQWTDL